MAGKKDKSQKKKNKPLSHIGTALFPRAIFAAVPRSPEPPQPARTPTPNLGNTRPPSALSTAIMDATFVGRAIANPSPNSTLRATGDFTPRGGVEAVEVQQAVESSSMARSSMYDYEDSEEEEDDDDEDLDYMGISKREREMEYNDDPGYARLEDVQEMLSHEKRGTISNRARMESPPISEEEESPRLTDRTATDTYRSQPVPSPRDPSGLPSTSQADIHSQDHEESHPQSHSQRHPQGQDRGYSPAGQDETDFAENSGKKKKKKAKEKKQKKENITPDQFEGLYAQPLKKHAPLERHQSVLSNESDLTGVSADDFSDLISPPPPWKRKPQSPDLNHQEALSGRSTKKSGRSKAKNIVNEPMIEKTRSDNNQYSAPPVAQQYNDIYSHLNRSGSINQSVSDDYLKRTNERLETELGLIQRERDDLMSTLDQRTKQLVEERGRRTDLNKSLGHVADLKAEVEELRNTCQNQQDEKRSLHDTNKQLRAQMMKLQDMAHSNHEDEGIYLNQLKNQAEAVIQENEDLKNIIHKVNVQLSRYQAKYAPPLKGDPPGLPSRGSTPRWLTDTKYLCPLITAYDAQLQEKEDEIQANIEEVEELRRSAEEVIRENQRLHRKLEENGGGGGIGPKAKHSQSWLNEIEQQASLVLEENQVVLEQMDLQQKKLHDQQRKHAQETLRLTKRLTLVESEKNAAENELAELQMKYGALNDQHERSVRDAESKMPLQEHLDAISEYKRSMHELKRQVETETENTLSKLTATETEKQSVAMRLADYQVENSQLKGEIQAMHKAQKRLQHKLTMLEKELAHSQARDKAANEHLNKVLQIAEQTAAERDSYKKMAHTQAQEKERAVNKMIAGNVAIGRMEEKLKMYKLRASNKMDDIMGRMKDQDELHTSRLSQYEREMKHLGQLVRDKQDALDAVAADKQKVEEELEVVWQSATEDNKRLKARLAKSLRSSSAADSNLMPFGSDSDNRGLLSSESD